MWNTKRYLEGLAALLLILAACVPKPTPASLPTPPASAPPQAGLTPAAPVANAEDVAWAKVVETAKKEGKVVAYSYYLAGDVGTGISKAFKAKYGIELEIVSGPGAMLIERIKNERRAGQDFADLFNSGPAIHLTAKGEGILQPIGNLPVLKEQGVWVANPQFDSDGYIVNSQLITYNTMVNTSLVKPNEEPKSWKDLLQPRWRGGKIVISDPAMTNGPVYVYWALTSRNKLDKSYFTELGRQEISIKGSANDPPAAIGRGESQLTFGLSGSSAGPMVMQGVPIKTLDMREGIPGASGASLSLAKNAPHPNSARLFLNWFLSKEGQEDFVKLSPVKSIRKDVPDGTPVPLRIVPTELIVLTAKDEEEVSRIMREKELYKLLTGK